MSEPIAPPTAPAAPAAEPTTPPEGKQESFDAEYVAKLRTEAAEWRVKAQEGKAAATKLAELEESQKSEAQKLADRLAAAEQRATAAESKAERARIAAEKGVPADLLVGDTAEALEAFADQLLAFRGGAPKMPTAPSAAGQGNVGKPVGTGQLTQADINRMTPQQIDKALSDGLLADVLAGKNS